VVPVLRVLGAAGDAVLQQLWAATRCPVRCRPGAVADGYHAVTADRPPAALRAPDDADAGDRAAAAGPAERPADATAAEL